MSSKRFVTLLAYTLLVLIFTGCPSEDEDGDSEPANAQPSIQIISSGDIQISSSGSAFLGSGDMTSNLAIDLKMTDSNNSNNLELTASVTGGSLTESQFGINETFPITMTGTSQISIGISGNAIANGDIEITLSATDGVGGTASAVLTLVIDDSPQLLRPVTTNPDMSINGHDPNFTLRCPTNSSLDMSFEANYLNPANILDTTITVTGGSLTPAQAGFNETFPLAPTGTALSHTVSLSGTSATVGTITFSVSVTNGLGTDAYNIRLIIGNSEFDFNGDGYNDVIICSHLYDVTSGGGEGAPPGPTYTDVGCVYIFFGSSTFGGLKTATPDCDVKIVGDQDGDWFGYSAATASDINNDGFDDLIVGAPKYDPASGLGAGAVYIFYGSATPLSNMTASINSDVKVTGNRISHGIGNSVSGAGDINNDGYDDFIFAATDRGTVSADEGEVFVFLGSSTLAGTKSAAADKTIRIVGDDIADFFGCSVSGAGDVNNDGFDDFIVGAWADDDQGSVSGSAFVFFGATTFTPLQVATQDADIKITGNSQGDNLGSSVSNAGDVNGDGIDDILIGARGNFGSAIGTGAAYLFYGSTSLSGTKVASSSADLTIDGDSMSDEFGENVAAAGDVNGDGFADFLIGTPLDDDAGTSSGTTFLFLGSATLSGVLTASSGSVTKFVGDSAGDRLGCSVHTAGDVNGDGYFDLVLGAKFDDDTAADSGSAFVVMGQSTLPSGAIAASSATSSSGSKIRGDSAGDNFGFCVDG